MDTIIPESKSLIRRSTHIVKIRIIKSKPESWLEKTESGIKTRNTLLEIKIIKVLKGLINFSNKNPVKISVFQAERMISRYIPIPGIWSEKPIDKGLQYFLFCQYVPESKIQSTGKTTPADAQDVLNEENTLIVLPIENNELNVKLVMNAENEELSLSEFLDTLSGHTKELNPLFAEYAGTRMGEVIFQDWEGYKKCILMLENPDLDLKTRVIFTEAVLHKLQSADPGPFEFYSLAIIGLFRILRLPGTELIHTNILQTYLPNLLGLKGAGSYKPAIKVFEHSKEERELSGNWLSDHKSYAHAQQIIEWIEKNE